MNAEQKKLAVLGVLVAVLVVVLAVVFRPGRKTAKAPAAQGAGDSTGVNIKEIDDNFRTILAALEKIGGEQSKNRIEVVLKRDPLLAQAAAPAVPGAAQSILRGDVVEPPSFALSGILYDETRPMAIIDNAVKGVNDRVGSFTVVSILPEKVIVGQKDRLFTVTVRPDERTGVAVRETAPAPPPALRRNVVIRDFEPRAAVQPKAAEAPAPRAAAPSPASPAASAAIPVSAPDATVRTIQVASFPRERLEDGVRMARRLEEQGFDDVRIEEIGGVCALRVGRYGTRSIARSDWREIRKAHPDSFIRDGYYRPERIAWPKDARAESGRRRNLGRARPAAASTV